MYCLLSVLVVMFVLYGLLIIIITFIKGPPFLQPYLRWFLLYMAGELSHIFADLDMYASLELNLGLMINKHLVPNHCVLL